MADGAKSVGESEAFGYTEVNGLPVYSFVKVDHLRGLQLYPDDVWVVTYPKCGTTWTQQIVKLVRNKGEGDGLNISESIPWLEGRYPYEKPIEFDKIPRPRAFKSHFPYDIFPCGLPHTTPCKYIYVMRNPKDVFVSYYHHMKTANIHDLKFDEFWRKFTTGTVGFGDYFDHLLSWLPHRDNKRILFLKFEDMKEDLLKAVRDIAEFLEVDLSEDVIHKIALETSFDRMKKDDKANMSYVKKFEGQFMRKGEVGDWKNFLTDDQSAEMDAICAARLKNTGLEFRYD